MKNLIMDLSKYFLQSRSENTVQKHRCLHKKGGGDRSPNDKSPNDKSPGDESPRRQKPQTTKTPDDKSPNHSYFSLNHKNIAGKILT